MEMVKIMSKIAPIEEELLRYRDLFSKPQFYHFCRYVTGLIIEEHSWTINNMNKLFFESKDQSSLNRFMTESPWDGTEVTIRRMKIVDQNPKTRTKRDGVIILDDTVNPKTGKKMEGVGWHHYNNPSSKDKFTFGHSVVSTHYADDEKEYPISPEIYIKKKIAGDKFKTKIAIGIGLINDAIKKYGIRAKTVIMDVWYLCKNVVNNAKELFLNWVSCAKVNRKVQYNNEEWMKISELIEKTTLDKEIIIGEDRYLCKSFVLRLSKIGLVKLVLSKKRDPKTDEEKKVVPIVTDRLDWDEFAILSKYLMRHHIEGFYRDSKQVLGLGKYMIRELDGVVRHLHLSFLAYTLLETIFIKGNDFFRWLKDKVLSIGERCKIIANLAVRGFVRWCNRQFRRRVPLYRMFEMLLV